MYPFNDANVLSWSGSVGAVDCALTMLRNLVLTPTDNRMILDAGSKVMSYLLDYQLALHGCNDLTYVNASEEHRWIDTSDVHGSIEVGSDWGSLIRTSVQLPTSTIRWSKYGAIVEEVLDVRT